MADEKKTVSASDLRGQTRHTVINPATGNTFEIRDVWTRDLYQEGLLPAPPGSGGDAPAVVLNIPELRKFEIAVLVQGCVDPKVVESGGDDDCIAVSDLPRLDRDFLIEEIIKRSGLLPEEVKADAASFRGKKKAA